MVWNLVPFIRPDIWDGCVTVCVYVHTFARQLNVSVPPQMWVVMIRCVLCSLHPSVHPSIRSKGFAAAAAADYYALVFRAQSMLPLLLLCLFFGWRFFYCACDACVTHAIIIIRQPTICAWKQADGGTTRVNKVCALCLCFGGVQIKMSSRA